MKNLVIVESPTKARTLSQFLGKDYQITASMGHVRDLPRGEFGVDVDHGFVPTYVIPKEKIKSVNLLSRDAAGADHLWLATDPDREGEGIAWNLLQVISEKSPSFASSSAKASDNKKATKGKEVKVPDYSRVVFHEITRDAVMEAFEHPRKIDDDLVRAQQARRVLDRLVGYKLSPLLWKKVKSGLSAGRVQSVALRLVVDREREIEAFVPVEYWVITAQVESPDSAKASTGRQSEKSKGKVFAVTLIKIGEKKAEVNNKEQADKIVADLKEAAYKVFEVRTKDAKKYPNPPFTTSTLQQSAANKLGFTPKRTMRLAQDLYENGLITYMRTDSVNLSPQATDAARKYIGEKFGKDYLPGVTRMYKVKSRLAQEAHEAIRPTNITVNSSQLIVHSNDHKKLYDLIWRRMVACQMAEAVVAETQVDVEAKVAGYSEGAEVGLSSSRVFKRKRPAVRQSADLGYAQPALQASSSENAAHGQTSPRLYLLRANGQEIKFDGWYKAYEKPPISDQVLPVLEKDETLDLKGVNSEQKFTEPPSRYTEATLIRDLEKNDIGRPSTYAPTISTLYERAYIERIENKKIAPTPIGKTTVDFLVKYFPEIVDLKFTAEMEYGLDEIAQGKREMGPTMEKFWEPFNLQVEKVAVEAEKMKPEVEESDVKCEKCGKMMVVRYGRFGKFLACSGFPECKNTKTLAEPTGLTCPLDGGKIVVKKTRRGRSFWGCENWPKCKYASWTKPSFASTFAKASDDKKATEGKPAITEDTGNIKTSTTDGAETPVQ